MKLRTTLGKMLLYKNNFLRTFKENIFIKKNIKVIVFFLSCYSFSQISDFKKIGKLKPKLSNEISSSNWSIGGETLDRDYTIFENWQQYLGATGAKKIRLQAGWAKCEQEKGVYDFSWLDRIIDNVIEQGLEPWLQTSYGNPIYSGGGDYHLGGGLPTSEEALLAWDNWVVALTKRYKNRVKIWEIWNEADINSRNLPNAYSELFIRTSSIIKSNIPHAKIYALSLGGVKKKAFVEAFLKYLSDRDKIDYVDEITLHGYTYRPEDVYILYMELRELIKKYSDKISINQGELGCPSTNQPYFALRNYDWTELSQAKWMLRKMLGDLGHDIPSLYFSIIDVVYPRTPNKKLENPTINSKGLIEANSQKEVVKLKKSYFAYQNITSVFDYKIQRILDHSFEVNTSSSISSFSYKSIKFNKQIVTLWNNDSIPSNSNQKELLNFKFLNTKFKTPVYVDMINGFVYSIPKRKWKKKGHDVIFKNIPIYDSPIIIAERSLLDIIPIRD